jgi:hypothetical protein
MLKKEVGQRTRKMKSSLLRKQEDGMIVGRAADGTQIRGRMRGKSVARELMEKEEKRLREKRKGKRRRRRA